jgi:phosphohistidine phosphatase SixA
MMRSASIALTVLLVAAMPVAGAQQAKGAAGIEASRRGGVAIVCRHGSTDSADENEATLRYDDPTTQRRLSAKGERQAKALGNAIRALEVPIGDVIASPMQRASRTAEIVFGVARLDSSWHTRGENFSGPKKAARLEMLNTPPSSGNRVIVSHIGTIYSAIPGITGQLDEGDCVVIRPRGGTGFDVIEVVPWRAWLTAAHLDPPAP